MYQIEIAFEKTKTVMNLSDLVADENVEAACERCQANGVANAYLAQHTLTKQYSMQNTHALVVYKHIFETYGAFNATRRKLNTQISNFNPESITFKQKPGEAEVVWRVQSIICHRGASAYAGHYWAYRRVGPGYYHKYDDTNVEREPRAFTAIELDRDLGEGGKYMMILERNN